MKVVRSLLFGLIASVAVAQVYNNTQTISASGVTIVVPNNGAIKAVFNQMVSGSPTSATVTTSGCTSGNICTSLDVQTYTADGYRTRTISTASAYDHYSVQATWSGGSNVSVTIGTTIVAPASTGGGVSTFPSSIFSVTGSTASYATGQTANKLIGTDSSGNVGLQTVTSAMIPPVVHQVGATFDGQGSALVTGTKVYITAPYACTLQAWNATVDTGTITVDVWKIATGTAIPTVSNSITASAKPAIATGTALHSTTLTGWTTSVSTNDIFGFNISAVSGATKASLVLQCQ